VEEKDIFGDDWDSLSNKTKLNGLDFSSISTILVLARDVGGGVYVPVDKLIPGYSTGGGGKSDPSPPRRFVDIRRDDRYPRARYNAALYAPAPPEPDDEPVENRLGRYNDLDGAGLVDDIDGRAQAALPIICPGRPVLDVGELANIYLTGPFVETAGATSAHDLKPFTKRILDFTDSPAWGRLDLHPYKVKDIGYVPGTYPDVPAGTLLGELFTLVPPDETRKDESANPDEAWSRIYGRVNINTAPKEVLEQLPWPKMVFGRLVDVHDLVNYVIAYREGMTYDGRRYSDERQATDASGIRGLRKPANKSDHRGFLTPGEIAVPLADYANKLAGWTNYSRTPEHDPGIRDVVVDRDYILERDSLYRAVSNLITVRSDTYAVNIRVDLYDNGDDPSSDPPLRSWYYIAVIDRSNCRTPQDTPAVLLFSEVN